MTGYQRYVAIGDSQTEGVGDGDDRVGLRGWADRLAERLAAANPGLEYANLAVRGRLAGQVQAEQLEPALRLRPDLATVVAGLNDLLRPGFEAGEVIGHLEAMFAELTGAGAQVVTICYPDIVKVAPMARLLRGRVFDFNARIRAAAARHGVLAVETDGVPFSTDARSWSPDRLHLSPLGHRLAAAAVAHALGLPDVDPAWREPLPALPPAAPWQTAAAELRWTGNFLGPWVYRRIRGRSSGDGRTAKRPELAPVTLRRAD